MAPLLAASLVSGAGGIFGQMMANSANKDLQNAANETSIRLAAENRQWQEMMANTAHQRQVKDMKAAGLNPILSATGGSGAATPSGNVANIGAAKVEDVLGKGVSSAMAAASLTKDLEQKDAQIRLTEESERQTASQTDLNTINAYRLANENRAVNPKVEASIARAAADKAQSNLDLKYIKYDNIQKRVDNAFGTANKAIDLIKPSLKVKQERPSTVRYDRDGNYSGHTEYHYKE